jgi:alginate O-acetyltransferase complex protein AlgI
MLFPTVEYALFFLVALSCAWSVYRLPRVHKGFLLLASYAFYGFWNWTFLPLLIGISVFAGVVAKFIQGSTLPAARKAWLVVGVTVCLGVLGYYKYTGFLLTNWFALRGRFAPPLRIPITSPLLPLGISFFVFHAISLLADCYRGKVTERVRLGDALLYIAFFPQLIAGPILRASRFLPQLAVVRNPDAIRVNRAFLLILSGLFKKVVISNMLATRLVEPVFSVPRSFGAGDTLLAIYGYAAQIYCDFSGYTDIAIGCALLFGFRLPRNFNAPYKAANPQEFWRRWHISLSRWMRDYLYFPLGGSRKGPLRTGFNLMLTMLLGGLWHGASWTFVAWGGLHGFLLVAYRLWSRSSWRELIAIHNWAAGRYIARILLFHTVCAGWVLFRAPSFEIALEVFKRLAVPGVATLASAPICIVLFLGLAWQYTPSRWGNALEIELGRWPAVARGAALAVVVALIEVLGPTGVAPFIYFQF